MTDNPAKHRIAAPHGWETAMMSELWRHSDATGVPASTILRALDKFERADAES